MKNTMPESVSKLTVKMGLAIPGVVKYAAALGLDATLSETMADELDALILAENNVKNGKQEVKTAYAVAESVRLTVRGHVTTVRDLGKRSLGSKYTTAFIPLGFDGSLYVPESIELLLGMLPPMISYIALHPTLANADLNVTAEHTTQLKDQLFAAKTAVQEKEADLKRLIETRDQKFEIATRRLRLLLKDLTFKLSPVDTRWPEFSFNPPGLRATPDVPVNVTAVLVGANAIAVKWTRAARANYYRVYAKINGVNQELIAVGSPSDLDFTLEGLPAATKVELAVAAVNNGGESQQSEIVTVTTV